MPTFGLRNLLDRMLAGERLTEGDITALSFEDRLRLIQRAPVRTKANLIISSPDPIKLLKKLSPQEIYLTVKESWGTDAAVILEMTAPDKIVQLLDMDIWKRDRIDFGKFHGHTLGAFLVAGRWCRAARSSLYPSPGPHRQARHLYQRGEG